MKRRWAVAAVVLLASVGVAAPAHDGTVAGGGREAFAQPLPGLSDQDREQFFLGRGLFRQSWVIAPAADSAAGLGPLYNQLSCIACHPKNGRGRAPDDGLPMRSMLLRLSLPGTGAHGGPQPHPVYGDQLSEQGVPGVPAEGSATLAWELFSVRLDDGTEVAMRRPRIELRALNYGPAPDLLLSARVASPVFGLGLLASIDDADLLARAALAKPDGVRGRVNRVWQPETERMAIGRFGLKANSASLRVQIADAMLGDLGITSTLHPRENCSAAQLACQRAPSGGSPELTEAELQAMTFYLQHVAAPARRDRDDPVVRRGEQLFERTGCVHCHLPQQRTRAEAVSPHLAAVTFHPYTDLLLHDMGDGLADGRPDFAASGREWRTPPLWGIGLVESINEYASYLHDGRARSLTEAVLWHDGEARVARDRYAALPREEREALQRFLLSL